MEEEIITEIPQPMSPNERVKVHALERLKHVMDNTDDPITLYKTGDKLGITSNELLTMIKLGMIVKRPSHIYRKFLYSWATGDPTRQLYKEITESAKKYHNDACRKSNLKKKKLERREMEKNRALREAASNKIKKVKLQSIKSEGKILDENNHDLINTLKAGSEGYSEKDLDKMAEHYQEKLVPVENAIPIEVRVTTVGNRKTININISI